jgi:hypothetical protein
MEKKIKLHKRIFTDRVEFFIWEPELAGDGMLHGPGCQAVIYNPTYNYQYSTDYIDNDSGWDRLFKSPLYRNEWEVSNGVSVTNGNLILFNLYRKPPVYRNVLSNTNYREYVPHLFGISFLHTIERFGCYPYADASLSDEAMRLVYALDAAGIAPVPRTIRKNEIDKTEDYSQFVIRTSAKDLVELDHVELLRGREEFFRVMSLIGGKKRGHGEELTVPLF